jgi:hypothetical protein
MIISGTSAFLVVKPIVDRSGSGNLGQLTDIRTAGVVGVS